MAYFFISSKTIFKNSHFRCLNLSAKARVEVMGRRLGGKGFTNRPKIVPIGLIKIVLIQLYV